MDHHVREAVGRRPRAVAVAVLLLAAACGSEQSDGTTQAEPPPVRQPAPPEQPAPPKGVKLPRIGTVGDAPTSAHRLDVGIAANGALTIDGADGDLSGLRGTLVSLVGDQRLSELDLVISADGRVRWGAIQYVLQTCAQTGVYRIWFAAQHSRDDAEGAIAVFLPGDGAIGPPEYPPVLLPVKVSDGWPPSDANALHTPFATHAASDGVVQVDARPETRLALVLSIVDVAAQQKCMGVTFTGVAGELPASLVAYTATLGDQSPRKITVAGADLTSLPGLIPVTSSVAGPAGFTTPPPVGYEDETPEDE